MRVWSFWWFCIGGFAFSVVVFLEKFVLVFAKVGGVYDLVKVFRTFLYLVVFVGCCAVVSEVVCGSVGCVDHEGRFE